MNTDFENLLSKNYPQTRDCVYLDNAGASLPPQYILDNFTQDLSNHAYSNPHSRMSSPSAALTNEKMNNVRLMILK